MLKVGYLYKLFGILHWRFVCFSLFNYVFLSVRTHGFVLYTLGYNVILLYLLCCSNCSSCDQSQLSVVTNLNSSVTLICPDPYRSVFFNISFFLKDSLGLSCIFTVPALESAIFPRSFYCRMVLDTAIWMGGMLIAVEV